jgi:hypothetical protein
MLHVAVPMSPPARPYSHFAQRYFPPALRSRTASPLHFCAAQQLLRSRIALQDTLTTASAPKRCSLHLECFNSLILRCSGSEGGGTSRFASRLIGEREIVRTHESRSRNSRDWRSSLTSSEHQVTESTVIANQIEQTPDHGKSATGILGDGPPHLTQCRHFPRDYRCHSGPLNTDRTDSLYWCWALDKPTSAAMGLSEQY